MPVNNFIMVLSSIQPSADFHQKNSMMESYRQVLQLCIAEEERSHVFRSSGPREIHPLCSATLLATKESTQGRRGKHELG